MNKKDLNEILNIEDNVQSAQQIVQSSEGDDEHEIDSDYQYTRQNL